MSLQIEYETPDSLAEKILAARSEDQAHAHLRAGRGAERTERDRQLAQEFATTIRLARALSS